MTEQFSVTSSCPNVGRMCNCTGACFRVPDRMTVTSLVADPVLTALAERDEARVEVQKLAAHLRVLGQLCSDLTTALDERTAERDAFRGGFRVPTVRAESYCKVADAVYGGDE